MMTKGQQKDEGAQAKQGGRGEKKPQGVGMRPLGEGFWKFNRELFNYD